MATFRRDAAYSDGRHPDAVAFSDAEHDAQRRDFTINGLFFDPLEDRVIDYVGGQDDLARRVIRAIGDPLARIAEDKLRMLRAVRFAARFDFAIEDRTLAAIKQQARELIIVSAERIAAELRLMLTATTRARAWRMLRRYALDGVIFRFLRLPTPPARPEVTASAVSEPPRSVSAIRFPSATISVAQPKRGSSHCSLPVFSSMQRRLAPVSCRPSLPYR